MEKRLFSLKQRLIRSIFGDNELEKLTQKIKGFGENAIDHFGSENWDTSLHACFHNVKNLRQHFLAPTHIMVLLY